VAPGSFDQLRRSFEVAPLSLIGCREGGQSVVIPSSGSKRQENMEISDSASRRRDWGGDNQRLQWNSAVDRFALKSNPVRAVITLKQQMNALQFVRCSRPRFSGIGGFVSMISSLMRALQGFLLLVPGFSASGSLTCTEVHPGVLNQVPSKTGAFSQ
jgi:hypothetical protein